MSNFSPVSPRPSQYRLEFLDGLRGLAALYVLIYHARELLFEGFHVGGQPTDLSPLNRLLAYALIPFGLGHQSVIFFFVLSGFVIHLRYARKLQQDPLNASFDWQAYTWRRIRRLVPPLLFAIFLTTLADALAVSQHYAFHLRTSLYPTINDVTYVNFNPIQNTINLLFGAHLQTWGSNNPLWSLRLEWWFYMLYPVFWWLSKREIRIPTVLSVVMFMVGLFVLTPLTFVELIRIILMGFPAWWLGAVLADLYTGRLIFPLKRVALLAFTLIPLIPFTLSTLTVDIPIYVIDLMWAFAFFGLLAGFLSSVEQVNRWRIWKLLEPLGDCSYTVYVTHYPLLLLMGGWLVSQSEQGRLPLHPFWMPVGIFLCIAIAYLAHFIVERPFAGKVTRQQPDSNFNLR